jgi:hypothetical protein
MGTMPPSSPTPRRPAETGVQPVAATGVQAPADTVVQAPVRPRVQAPASPAVQAPIGAGLHAPAAEPAPDSSADGKQAAGFLQRASLRRRLLFLRRSREVALRDLGGFVHEAHRQGEARPALLSEKLAALDALEGERQTLERALDDRQELVVLREPGITACPQCSTIHGSDARFCPGCGIPTRGAHSADVMPHGTGPDPAGTRAGGHVGRLP